jgi:hypothetical protein
MQVLAAQTSPEKATAMENQLGNSLNSALSSLGYEPLGSNTLTAIGDVRVIGRYALLNDASNTLTARTSILLPTGKTGSADQLIPLQTGGGRYSATFSLLYDRELPLVSQVRWLNFAYSALLFSSTADMRIPTPTSPLSADRDNVARGTAGEFGGGSSLEYTISSIGTTLGVGYQFQHATQQNYSGARYDANRYGLLTRPSQSLHSGTASVSFSTTGWYRQSAFPVPMTVTASYNHALGGSNAVVGDVVSGEMILYF